MNRITKIFIVLTLASILSTLHSAGSVNKSLSKDTAKVLIISQKDKEARLIILIDKTSKTDYNYQEKVDPIGYALDLEARGLI